MTPCGRHPLHVLVVDDDPSIRQIVYDLLLMKNHTAASSPDGETAEQLLKTTTFDLLITDLGLPGFSGWELARIAKRYQPAIGIIVITSWQGNEAAAKIRERGIDIIIWKPFRLDQISEAVTALGRHKSDAKPGRRLPLST